MKEEKKKDKTRQKQTEIRERKGQGKEQENEHEWSVLHEENKMMTQNQKEIKKQTNNQVKRGEDLVNKEREIVSHCTAARIPAGKDLRKMKNRKKYLGTAFNASTHCRPRASSTGWDEHHWSTSWVSIEVAV